MKRIRGAAFASGALASLVVGVALGASWDERVFSAGSHLDFDAVAAAGPVGAARADRARPRAVQGEVHHRRRRRTAEGDAGDRPDQAQESASIPPFSRTSGPDSNSCFGCHNDPIVGGSGDFVANVFVSEGFESAQFDFDRSVVLERAAHDRADGRTASIELLAREMTADLQGERAAAVETGARTSGETCAPTSSSKGVRFGAIVAHPDGIVDLDARRGRRRRSDRAAVQPQGRVHFAAPVHHQRAQRPPRHGGDRTLRRALDRQPRLRRKRRARRDDAGRRLGAGGVPGDAAAADRQDAICPTTGGCGRRRATSVSTRSAAPPATCRRCR